MTAYDFDGDGVKEVVAHSTDTNVYVFDPVSGKVLAALPTTYPPAWYIQQVSNGIEVAELIPGEGPSIVVGNHAGYVAAWRFDADASRSDRFAFEKTWEDRADGCRKGPSMDAKVTLADLTGDDRLELLVQTEEEGLFAYDAEGNVMWEHCWSGGHSAPVADDLDGDGKREAIFVSDSGFLSVFDGAKGDPLWTFDAAGSKDGIKPGSAPVAPTVADLDGDGIKEVIFTARHAPQDDSELYDEFHMGIFAVHQNRETWQTEVVWKRQPEWANPMSYTHLIVDDVDGDGAVDIFGMDWNTIGHRPGNWERLGPGHAFRLDAQGNDVWVREVDAYWSNKDIAIGDVDGDGEPNVVVNGPRAGVDGMWFLKLDTGGPQGFVGAPDWKVLGGPLLLDTDGDGKMELLFRATPDDDTDERGAILVFDLEASYDAPHPGHG